jgi:hypothetical protein
VWNITILIFEEPTVQLLISTIPGVRSMTGNGSSITTDYEKELKELKAT